MVPRRILSTLPGVLLSALLLAGTGQDGRAQSQILTPPNNKLEFEVASIRQNRSGDEPSSTFSLDSSNLYSTVNREDALAPTGGYFSATNQPLWRYIVFAYKLTGTQELALRFNFFAGLASHVPDWVNTDRFDIKARFEGSPSKDQVRQMMQALLADRFNLTVHHETRQAPVFALVLLKPGSTGPNLKQHPNEDRCSSETTPAGLPVMCGVIAHLAPRTGRNEFWRTQHNSGSVRQFAAHADRDDDFTASGHRSDRAAWSVRLQAGAGLGL